MALRASIAPAISAVFTSRTIRSMKRSIYALPRHLTGAQPLLHYFHQADDPYSHLAAQLLQALANRYDVKIKPWLVPPPDDAAAPERGRLEAYALRDAARLARRFRLQFPADAVRPSTECQRIASAALVAALDAGQFTERAVAIGSVLWNGETGPFEATAEPERIEAALRQGEAERKRLGHYLGAMFYFEGEWYWGVDRLHHLETRLAALDLDKDPNSARQLAPYQHEQLCPRSHSGVRPQVEVWFSFRSPYTWIAVPRIIKLARHYGASLRLRCILPMVMRGLPVPPAKRFYIVLDTKREAEMVGLPFGRIVDPVGKGAERALAVVHRATPLGLGEAFAEAALAGAFAQGIDLADDDGLLAIARQAGLRDEDVAAALADESWREEAEQNRVALLDAGLWGAPTFRINGGPAHWGQDRIWALEEDIIAALALPTAAAPPPAASSPAHVS